VSDGSPDVEEIYKLADVLGGIIAEFESMFEARILTAALAVATARIVASSVVATGVPADKSYELFEQMMRAHFRTDMDLATEIENRGGFN
jgi:hypothetical protein